MRQAEIEGLHGVQRSPQRGRAFITERALERRLGGGPEWPGFAQQHSSRIGQDEDAATTIAIAGAEGEQPACLERAEQVPQSRAIHDEPVGEIPDGPRPKPVEPRQDRILIEADGGGCERLVEQARDMTRRLAQGRAIAGFRRK